MSHPTISLDSRIRLRPLSTQLENGVAIIGRSDQFLELPAEGLQFLAWVDEGLTLAEARVRFEARYSSFSDTELLEVIEAFSGCDFIAAVDGQPIPPRTEGPESQSEWLPQSWARLAFSRPILVAWLLVVIPATALWVLTPALWPRRADYFWLDYNFVIILVGLLLWLLDMFLHETAHLVACRAKGIDASITWTQRLGFMPMSQTIMHNIWAAPRPARYLPLAAGMMVDILRISGLVYLLYFQGAGLLLWPPLVVKFLKFYLLTSTLALVAQFWLFSKMDGYFLVSALLGQRNLQADTFQWLKSKIHRQSQFDPPAGGMKFIYLYALITLVGGGLFLGQFLLVQLPIKVRLIWESILKISYGLAVAPLEFADGLAVLTSQTIELGLLLYAYWRDTLPEWRSS